MGKQLIFSQRLFGENFFNPAKTWSLHSTSTVTQQAQVAIISAHINQKSIEKIMSYFQTLPPLRATLKSDPQAQAAYRLFSRCANHIGGSTEAIASFLVGLYNRKYSDGYLNYLCRWSDDATFEDLMATMKWVRSNQQLKIQDIFTGNGSKPMSILMERFELGPFARRTASAPSADGEARFFNN